MTVPNIAGSMGQSRQAVQRLANEMQSAGLLETQHNPDHQRAKLLKLTEKGHKAYAAAMQKQIPWVNELAAGAKEADLKNTLVVLQELADRMHS